MSFLIFVVNFNLVADQSVGGLIILLLFPGDDNFLDVVEDSFELVEADIVLVVSSVQFQVLLYLVVLVNSGTVLFPVMLLISHVFARFNLRVDGPEVDVVAQFNVLNRADLIEGGVVAI
jgi:hypothetical protein